MNQLIPTVEITIPAPTVQVAVDAAKREVAKAWEIDPDALTGKVVSMEPSDWLDDSPLSATEAQTVTRWDVTVRVSPVKPTRLSEGGRIE